MDDRNTPHIQLGRCAAGSNEPFRVIVNCNLSAYRPQSIFELNKPYSRRMAERYIKEDREYLLFKERRFKLKRQKHRRDNSTATDQRLQRIRKGSMRNVDHRLVGPELRCDCEHGVEKI